MDNSLFEAGAIDGVRNRWQELAYITVPSMAPQLLFSAVMQIGASVSYTHLDVYKRQIWTVPCWPPAPA